MQREISVKKIDHMQESCGIRAVWKDEMLIVPTKGPPILISTAGDLPLRELLRECVRGKSADVVLIRENGQAIPDRYPVREQRFEREAKTISSLNHSSHLRALWRGHQNGTDYLVMECVEGETLTKATGERAAALGTGAEIWCLNR